MRTFEKKREMVSREMITSIKCEPDGVIILNGEYLWYRTTEQYNNLVRSLGLPLVNSDTRKLLLHSFVKIISDEIVSASSRTIIFVDENLTKENKNMAYCFKKLKTVFRLNLWNSPISFEDASESLRTGDVVSTSILDATMARNGQRMRNMSKVKRFLLENGLTNLSEDHFQNIKNCLKLLS